MNRIEFLELLCSDRPLLSESECGEIMQKSVDRCTPAIKSVVCMEELAELIQQISKQIRNEGDDVALLEEMADAFISISMLARVYDIDDETLTRAIDAKLIREKKRNDEYYGSFK